MYLSPRRLAPGGLEDSHEDHVEEVRQAEDAQEQEGGLQGQPDGLPPPEPGELHEGLRVVDGIALLSLQHVSQLRDRWRGGYPSMSLMMASAGSPPASSRARRASSLETPARSATSSTSSSGTTGPAPSRACSSGWPTT